MNESMTYEEAMKRYYAAHDRMGQHPRKSDEWVDARMELSHWREVAEDIRRAGVLAVYTPRKVKG